MSLVAALAHVFATTYILKKPAKKRFIYTKKVRK